MKTPSLWYTGVEQLELREVDLPDPQPNEALIEVEACGVCTWDLFIYSGGFQDHVPYPFYFGHEGIGRVLSAGSAVARVRPGDRVALRESPDIGKLGTGHMAGHAVLPESLLIPLPESDLPASRWLVEPVACCVNAVDRAAVRCGERVALVGCGFMGGILLQGLLMTPAARVLAIDVRPELLEVARGFPQLGQLETALAPDVTDEESASFDLVVETSATEAGFRLANRLVKKGGRLLVFSWQHEAFPVDLGHWHVNGITVLNVSPAAHPRFDECFHQSIALIEAGRIDLGPLVTHEAAPQEAAALYASGLAKTDGYIKGMIRWAT